jgi:acetyl-CoA C-acetyltransferase
MTNAPRLVTMSRHGVKYGSLELLDCLATDGLVDAFDHVSMGELTDIASKRLQVTRAAQDEFAVRSYQRAALAQDNGVFEAEIVPVSRRAGSCASTQQR